MYVKRKKCKNINLKNKNNILQLVDSIIHEFYKIFIKLYNLYHANNTCHENIFVILHQKIAHK